MSSYSKSTGKGKYVALAVLLIVVGTVAALELTNTTHFFHKKNPPVTADQYTKGQSNSSSDTSNSSDQANSGSNPAPAPQVQKSPPSAGVSGTLIKPSGDFVSNHDPSLGNSDRNTESSVCTTTPGAKCTIMFVKGGQTKSLAARTTDSGGSAYWDWKLQDIGLTTGSWQIKVVATLGGKTSTAYDAQNLEVSP